MRELTEEEINEIEAKIENEGLLYYLLNYAEDVRNTELEEPLRKFVEAVFAVQVILESWGIDDVV